MKAIIWTKYGPPEVLKLKEVQKPIPKENEVLVKIHAASVTMGDCEMRSLKFSGTLKLLMRLIIGLTGPRKRFSILGQDFAGEIEDVGSDVTHFKKGEPVFGTNSFRFGTYAEYVCVPEDGIITKKPFNITYEEAVAVPTGGLEALYYLKKAKIQKGQAILIRGASGSIGTVAIQLAKNYGGEVTAIGNPTSLEVMKSLGADKVIDYTKHDFTENYEKYDVIFDIIGRISFSDFKGIINKNGIFLLANPDMNLFNREKRLLKDTKIKYISGNKSSKLETIEQLNQLKELIEKEKIKSVIDKRYPLEKIVEAHNYVETGQKTGNVIINLENND